MSLKPMCCIHNGLPLQAHSTHIWHHPPQHSLPVSFDTVARELSPRTQFHRFASWKGDVPFIIQMLIALREAREERLVSRTQLSLFFTSTSTEACHRSAAEDSHYCLLNPSPHQRRLRICFVKALARQNKEQQLSSWEKEKKKKKPWRVVVYS